MKNVKPGGIGIAVMLALVLSFAGEFAIAASDRPMTPEVAAKRENFRKQHEQRVTDKQRKAAADGLKAERLKVFKAKQLVKKANQEKTDPK